MSFTFNRDGSAWDAYLKPYMEASSHIIALRGARSYNGISRAAADQILNKELRHWLLGLSKNNSLVFMYDGDDESIHSVDSTCRVPELPPDLRRCMRNDCS